MPPITSFPGELWGYHSMPSIVNVDFLLPNGFLITLECSRDTTLIEAKQSLWKEALKYPLYDDLKPQSSYIFASVTQEAKNLEYYDEKKRICDLKLFHPFFKLVEAQGDLEEKSLNSDISKAIGLYSNEIEGIKDNEMITFRLSLLNILNEHLDKKKALKSDLSSLDTAYSPNLESDSSLLDTSVLDTTNILNSVSLATVSSSSISNANQIDITIHVQETNLPRKTYSLSGVELNQTPTDIIVKIIRMKLAGSNNNEQQIVDICKRYKDAYLLNICGCDDILYGNKCPIGSYKYVKSCILNGKSPNFHLVSLEKVRKKIPNDNIALKSFIDRQIKKHVQFLRENPVEVMNAESSWNVTKSFQLHLNNAIYMPSLKDCEKLFFKLAIYHGQETVSQVRRSNLVDYSSLKWYQTIDFNVNVRNLHRCAKICVALYCQSKRKNESFALGFISLNLFDYKGFLISGKKTLYLWEVSSSSSFSNLCIRDITGQNPNKNYICVQVEFPQYKQYSSVMYPRLEDMRKFIKATLDKTQDECFDCDDALENDNEMLKEILDKDALAELTEQDKSVLWRRRLDCIHYPHSLPKLLQAVKWSSKDDVIEIYRLLLKWPNVKPVVAFELLNGVYADIEVRSFAIRCLDAYMKDEEIQQYLLQLVQALKNEPYYENALTSLLLHRAFKSQRIGFDLFWHLKSEMKNEKYKYRFGLILEAYCRGIGGLIKHLLKQIDVVEKLSILAETVKENREDLSILKGPFLKETLEKPDYREVLSNFISPLDRSHLHGVLDTKRCKILSSAKRPLYLTWNNASEYSDMYESSFEVIFKHGDDLRQDMLTLQILKLMDTIWKSEGMDLKMLIYQVFSTGSFTGFIQVVKNAKTLFKIQMDGGIISRYQIDTLQLFKWISQNNSTPEKLDKAIDLFTRSCAAYCVATFILGIGDRHPDNIMVNNDGQIFHIDFGHFLGNFKKKFGIKRERVPFVLTEDFVRVIARGAANPAETPEFEKFRNVCETAYMTIRRHSHLIINLFTLMLASDMPELQTIDDIMYLRKTLAIDETDANAREYFRKQLNESYTHSYTTKLDWMCHALNRKNLI